LGLCGVLRTGQARRALANDGTGERGGGAYGCGWGGAVSSLWQLPGMGGDRRVVLGQITARVGAKEWGRGAGSGGGGKGGVGWKGRLVVPGVPGRVGVEVRKKQRRALTFKELTSGDLFWEEIH